MKQITVLVPLAEYQSRYSKREWQELTFAVNSILSARDEPSFEMCIDGLATQRIYQTFRQYERIDREDTTVKTMYNELIRLYRDFRAFVDSAVKQQTGLTIKEMWETNIVYSCIMVNDKLMVNLYAKDSDI